MLLRPQVQIENKKKHFKGIGYSCNQDIKILDTGERTVRAIQKII
jgi:hypothetical protein